VGINKNSGKAEAYGIDLIKTEIRLTDDFIACSD